MNVDKIFLRASADGNEFIFQLDDGRRIIKRTDDKTKKLNIDKWEEVNFIPDNFIEIDRDLTEEEEIKLKKFVNKNSKNYSGNSFLEKITAKLKNIF